ncbi:MAG TPA: RNA methyltransferase [Acidimicrobiales bacterium]
MRRLRRLLLKRAVRRAERAFVVEGAELVRAALAAGSPVESLFVAHGAGASGGVAELVAEVHRQGGRVFDLAAGVLERVASTVAPQPLLAVVPALDVPLDQAVSGRTLVVLCAEVRDPGNAGTVLRSADAAGAGAVVFCGETVDPYNPKTVRASAGSLFHLPVAVTPKVTGTLDALGALGFRRLGAAAHQGDDYLKVPWTEPTALVLGNESSGLAPDLAARLDGLVRIPMAGRAESLNVGVACAVLCFEALRRRQAEVG